MTAKTDLLDTRFRLNMNRISGLVQLLSSHDALKPTTVFGSSGARADILRSIVVFLHATFEVVLRSHLPPNRSINFYSRTDLEKALKLSCVDAKPFRPLFPTLTQMAKRRKRIVHEADLLRGEPQEWSVADDWQLIMWLLAVPAFYYQLRISLHVAGAVECTIYERLRESMLSHVKFANQLLAFSNVPPELRVQALQETVVTLKGIIATLKLDASAFVSDENIGSHIKDDSS
jgi:hypothetical protein